MRVLAVVLLLGCGGGVDPKTMADACFNWADVLCSKAASCGTTESVEKCRANTTSLCCSVRDCTAPVGNCASTTTCCADTQCSRMMVDIDAVNTCTDGFRAQSCGQVAGGITPNSCM